MEDTHLGIFNAEPDQLFYKQILSDNEAIEVIDTCNESILEYNIGTSLVTGVRMHCDINLHEDFNFIYERLHVVLRDYFPDIKINHDTQYYDHIYGSTKRHIDKNHDNISNYTLLLYLSNDFDDGRLSIRTKRSELECQQHDINMKHKVFTIQHLRGYGIIFNKSLFYWANEIYTGNERFLIIHIHSVF